MKTLFKHLFALFMRCALWFRYKVTIVGLEKLTPETLSKPGGVLFLPNHPSLFVDPALVTLAVWPRFPIRPLIVEYQFYAPVVNQLMRWLDALPIPNFHTSTNSFKRKRNERAWQTVIKELRNGQNFLIYPAGKLKLTGYEAIGGASGVHRIIQEAQEANVVLVRIKGLWGSSFSRSITGAVPSLFPTIFSGVKHALKNLLFFTPRRHVILEFEPAPADFPYKGSRLELNHYLEAWYNRPDGLSKQQGQAPGDSLMLVSYSRWKPIYATPHAAERREKEEIDLTAIPEDVKQKVLHKISEITEFPIPQIAPEMQLATDLGMDSLDMSEMVIFLQDYFDIKGVPGTEMTSVGRVMAIASKQVVCKEEMQEEVTDTTRWFQPVGERVRKRLAEGKTIPEVFLNNCDRMGKAVACADMRSGVMTYSQLKMRALLLAEYIRKQPGDFIGIMLPASVAANLLILAVQLAGKVPMMINWTIGPRHLESVIQISQVKTVLTAWSFLDKMENVDLTPIEDRLIMLEDLRREFSLGDKLKAFMRSRQSAKRLLKKLKLDQLSEDGRAVLLFTSGTESMPKGVPLSHKNVLSNQRAAFDGLKLYSDDILLGMLPPFHSFGFTVTGLLTLLSGIRVAFSPDPTDGKRLVQATERWGATILCGPPTFLKAIFKSAQPEQLRSVRLCFSGAEKAPPELFAIMHQYGGEDFFVEGYGITECSPVLTFNRQGKPRRGVGLPAQEVELCIVHPDTYEDLPTGSQGMILARGPNVFSGYLNPGLSSPFVDHRGLSWYKTGDLGFLDEEGNLTISGRLKRFVKIGAEMISLASVEDGLLQIGLQKGWPIHSDGPSLAVCAQEIVGEKPRFYLFTKLGLDTDEVNKTLRDAGFSNLVKISQVIKLDEIPVMGTGKTNYRLLESEYLPK
ncbi:MAG: AMP-binding protein [Parachlamydia sp.]|nr:AMP-binding protein [Parachlamydia sp.]